MFYGSNLLVYDSVYKIVTDIAAFNLTASLTAESESLVTMVEKARWIVFFSPSFLPFVWYFCLKARDKFSRGCMLLPCPLLPELVCKFWVWTVKYCLDFSKTCVGNISHVPVTEPVFLALVGVLGNCCAPYSTAWGGSSDWLG